MAGEGGLHGDAGGFFVAYFADENDVWILAEDAAEGTGESHADFGVGLDLPDEGHADFDGVFDGHDVDVGRVHPLVVEPVADVGRNN